MSSKPRIIFDTSALNALVDDVDSGALTGGIKEGFFVRITALNAMEITAASDDKRKETLLLLCSRFEQTGDAIREHNWIISTLIRAYQSNPSQFGWKGLDVRYRVLERELFTMEAFTQQIGKEQRDDARSRQRNFNWELSKARPVFDKYFAKYPNDRPETFADFLDSQQKPDGAFWFFARILCRKEATIVANESTLSSFIEACPPFRALVLAHCLAQYQRSVKDLKVGPSYNAGAFDLYASVYLPYCDQFVTNDSNQRNALQEIASIAQIPATVQSYNEFCGRFLFTKR